MGYPPPIRADGDRPVLARRDDLPPGLAMKPKQADAQLFYADGIWRPAKVLGWLRLDVAHKQPITLRWIFWLVQMQLADGQEAWFEYDSLNLRPQARSR